MSWWGGECNRQAMMGVKQSGPISYPPNFSPTRARPTPLCEWGMEVMLVELARQA